MQHPFFTVSAESDNDSENLNTSSTQNGSSEIVPLPRRKLEPSEILGVAVCGVGWYDYWGVWRKKIEECKRRFNFSSPDNLNFKFHPQQLHFDIFQETDSQNKVGNWELKLKGIDAAFNSDSNSYSTAFDKFKTTFNSKSSMVNSKLSNSDVN